MPSNEAVEAALIAYNLTSGNPKESMRAAIQAAVEAEREACARIADAFDVGDDDEGDERARRIAAAIRARKSEAREGEK